MNTQPALNQKERNRAFWKFFLFLMITIFTVVAAVYFNFHVPTKENKILKKEKEDLEAYVNKQEGFTANVIEANNWLDSMDMPGANVNYISHMVTTKITDLSKVQLTDNTNAAKLNKTVLDVLLKYQNSKSKLLSLAETAAQLEKLQRELLECRNQLNSAQNQLDLWRNAQQ